MEGGGDDDGARRGETLACMFEFFSDPFQFGSVLTITPLQCLVNVHAKV